MHLAQQKIHTAYAVSPVGVSTQEVRPSPPNRTRRVRHVVPDGCASSDPTGTVKR
jgi:hypothetical protein